MELKSFKIKVAKVVESKRFAVSEVHPGSSHAVWALVTLRESLCKCFPAPPKPGQNLYTSDLTCTQVATLPKTQKMTWRTCIPFGLAERQKLSGFKPLKCQVILNCWTELTNFGCFLSACFFKLLPFGNRCSTYKLLLLLVAQLQGASPEEIKAAYKRLAKDGIFRVHVMGRLQMGILDICWSSLLISWCLLSWALCSPTSLDMQFSA